MTVQQIYERVLGYVNKDKINLEDKESINKFIELLKKDMARLDLEIPERQSYYFQVSNSKMDEVKNLEENKTIKRDRPPIWIRLFFTIASIQMMMVSWLLGVLYIFMFYENSLWKDLVDKIWKKEPIVQKIENKPKKLDRDVEVEIAENNFKILLKRQELLAMFIEVLESLVESQPEYLAELIAKINEIMEVPVSDFKAQEKENGSYALVPKLTSGVRQQQ